MNWQALFCAGVVPSRAASIVPILAIQARSTTHSSAPSLAIWVSKLDVSGQDGGGKLETSPGSPPTGGTPAAPPATPGAVS